MKKNIIKILFIFLGIIILILILLPGFVKRYAINHSKEIVGRQIQIDKLKYNYLTSTIKVYDFKMLEKNEQGNFIAFDTLIVNLEPLALIKDKIEIEEFYLKNLDINTVMKDSVFNFDDLIAFHSTEKDTTNQNTDKNPFKFSISNIYIEDSDFHFENQDIEHTTNIENLSFLVPFIGWDQEEKSNADVKFNFPRGGYFETKLNINPIDGEFDATLTISDLYLDPFYKYVAQYAEINSFKGLVSSKINITGNTNEGAKAIVSGQVKVNDFEMTDKNDKTFLSAKEVNGIIEKIDYFNSSYVVNSLIINESYTFFQLDSVSNNISRIFKIDDSPEKNSVNENAPIHTKDSIVKVARTDQNDFYYAINHLEVNKGILDYTDNLTGEPFNYHLSDIEIDSDSLFSDSKWINIYSDMLLNNRGTLNAKVGFDPNNTMNINLDISIEKFLLSDINIYTNHYTGHTILDGDMFYYSNSIITNGDIASENQLLIKNVSLNSSKGGLYNLPLKFALFLLKDKNDDVNLNIPVRGDMNDPTVNVSKLIWSTFKNLIIKAAASPGKLLAGLVDGDPKDIEEIKFNFIDSVPTVKNYSQLDKLLELEQKKEELKIEMVYYVDKQLQKEAIAKDEAGKIYFNETKKNYLKDEKDFETFLLSKTAADALDFKQSYISLSNSTLLDSISKNNTKLIISNIEKYLETQRGATQIKIIVSDPKAPENTGSFPTLKVNFSLKEDESIETNTVEK